MKNIHFFRSGFMLGIGFLSAIALFIGAYAAYSTLSVNGGDALSASKWNELLKYTNPPGTIIAYSGTVCPTNWSEYTQARGKFLRGYDPTASYDPDGASRTIGSIQTDAFQGHHHGIAFSVDDTGLPNIFPYMSNGYSSTYENGTTNGVRSPVTDGINGTPRTTSETRPKNIVVLFCIKD